MSKTVLSTLLLLLFSLPATAQDGSKLPEGFTVVDEAENMHSRTFAAKCMTKTASAVVTNFESGLATATDFPKMETSAFDLSAYYAKSKAGTIRGYIDLDFPNGNSHRLEKNISDADALISDDFVDFSGIGGISSIRLKRVFKKDWYGVYLFNAFPSDGGVLEDTHITKIWPIECKGEVTR